MEWNTSDEADRALIKKQIAERRESLNRNALLLEQGLGGMERLLEISMRRSFRLLRNSVDPRKYIFRHPLAILGASVAAGVVLGRMFANKESSKRDERGVSSRRLSENQAPRPQWQKTMIDVGEVLLWEAIAKGLPSPVGDIVRKMRQRDDLGQSAQRREQELKSGRRPSPGESEPTAVAEPQTIELDSRSASFH